MPAAIAVARSLGDGLAPRRGRTRSRCRSCSALLAIAAGSPARASGSSARSDGPAERGGALGPAARLRRDLRSASTAGLALGFYGLLAPLFARRARPAAGPLHLRPCSRSATACARRACAARSTSPRPSRRRRSAASTCARSRTSSSSMLPAQTYVKGFLRTYADYLGLDGQLYVDEYNSRYVERRGGGAVPRAQHRRRAPPGPRAPAGRVERRDRRARRDRRGHGARDRRLEVRRLVGAPRRSRTCSRRRRPAAASTTAPAGVAVVVLQGVRGSSALQVHAGSARGPHALQRHAREGPDAAVRTRARSGSPSARPRTSG